MLFDRVVSLTVGDGKLALEIQDLRISFTIRKDLNPDPNKSTVRIWNLTKNHRAMIEKPGTVVWLKAGYSLDAGLVTIFTGTVVRAYSRREREDIVTELQLEDGFLEYRDTKVSLSFAKGTKLRTILQTACNQFGLGVRPLPEEIAETSYNSGFAFVGRLKDCLNKICANSDLQWSIQNREVQVIHSGGYFRKKSLHINANSGMIGSPRLQTRTVSSKKAAQRGISSQSKDTITVVKSTKTGKERISYITTGYRVSTLLQPTIEPGQYVKVTSIALDGEWLKVEEVTHRGDTFGQWETTFSGRKI